MPYSEMIIKQSPWLNGEKFIQEDVHLQRLAEFDLIYHEEYFLNYPFQDGVYIVTGPRQIGKSTHLKLLIKQKINAGNYRNFLYFNCDLLDRKQDIVYLIEEYLTLFPTPKERCYVILDEITSVKDSFLAIKFLVDSGQYKNLTYILTGSNTISVKKTGEYLPGRRGKGIDFHFKPLSFKSLVQLLHPDLNITLSLNEFQEKNWLDLKNSFDFKQLLDDYLITGGFPRVINEYHQNQFINDDIFIMYRAWITSEIAKADRKEYIAKSILERCIISLGSDISYNAFAQDSGIGSHNTVYDYIDFFLNCYILSQIYHFDLQQKKINYRKNKKIYFNDPFIYAVIEAWLTGKPRQNFDYLNSSEKKSQLIENLCFLKLEKIFTDVFFYKENQEIDFVTDAGLFEVKYQNKIISQDYKSLLNHDAYSKLLISKDLFKKTDELLIVPVELFLLLSS
jgi:uncharacterized protein